MKDKPRCPLTYEKRLTNWKQDRQLKDHTYFGIRAARFKKGGELLYLNVPSHLVSSAVRVYPSGQYLTENHNTKNINS